MNKGTNQILNENSSAVVGYVECYIDMSGNVDKRCGSRPLNKASIGKHTNSPLENRCFLPK